MGGLTQTGKITNVAGLTVGHYTDTEHATGCTVVLCQSPAVAGIDVRGAAPGSRDTEMLHPLATFERVNGIVLTGGSVFGLASADGATQFLFERGIGNRFGGTSIPICPAAVIFDLALATRAVWPNAQNGYSACEAASADVPQGSVGAGTGATLGGLRGPRRRIKGGIGTASVELGHGLVLGALIVVNPIGSVVDPDTGRIVAGRRASARERRVLEDTVRILIEDPPDTHAESWNTVIGVVATNAALNKKEACRLAGAGQDAISLAVHPAHTAVDGDTIFALATGEFERPVHQDRLRAAATRAVVASILSAVEHATGLGGVPSAAEYLANG